MNNPFTDSFFEQSGDGVLFTELGGVLRKSLDFVLDNQLLRRDLWISFVSMFRLGLDSDNNGWRGEYFGKMARGACYVYKLTRDRRLYDVLTDAMEDILSAQREDGTISSYRAGEDFRGWDLWARKYVLLAMYYFMEICEDAALRERLLSSAVRQLRAIIRHIGPEEEGKIPVTKASSHWRGLNSSSILEPVMLYYGLTRDETILDFARYIVDDGGIEDGDIVGLAFGDRIPPYKYPVTKAYEMISFMEGLLEYAVAVNDRRASDAVERFAYKVLDTDFTVIGSGGMTHELFDHSSWRQSSAGICEIAQETCVTVTMMKFFSRMFRYTGDPRFADALEISFYNGYLGALNTEKQVEEKINRDGNFVPEFLPFDSYSPLTPGKRGKAVGGLMPLPGGKYYGCCACIGSLGAGIMGLSAVTAQNNVVVIEHLLPGTFEAKTGQGETFVITVKTEYPYGTGFELVINAFRPVEGELKDAPSAVRIRIPEWMSITGLASQTDQTAGTADAAGNVTETMSNGYLELSGNFCAGQTFRFGTALKTRVIAPVIYGTEQVGDQTFIQDPAAAERICVTRGPVTLAARAGTDGELPEKPLPAGAFTDVNVSHAKWTAGDGFFGGSGERKWDLCGEFTAGGESIFLYDYASAGKKWDDGRFGAWFRVT